MTASDDDLQRLADVLAEADDAYQADLDELAAAGADETFRDQWAANPESDPDTDRVEAPEGGWD